MTSPLRSEKGLYWDQAWYLVDGCVKIDESCKNCWAQDLPGRFDHIFRNDTLDENKQWNGKVFFNEDKFYKIDRNKPGIIYSIWNDLFHENISFDQITRSLKKAFLISKIKRSTFLILTKRPHRLADWLKDFKKIVPLMYDPFIKSEHLWFGTSVSDSSETSMKRLKELLSYDFPVANKFLSIEPILDKVNFFDPIENGNMDHPKVILLGCESGSSRRPVKQGQLDSIIKQCKDLQINLFLKQWVFNGRFCKPDKFPEDFKGRYNTLPWD